MTCSGDNDIVDLKKLFETEIKVLESKCCQMEMGVIDVKSM